MAALHERASTVLPPGEAYPVPPKSSAGRLIVDEDSVSEMTRKRDAAAHPTTVRGPLFAAPSAALAAATTVSAAIGTCAAFGAAGMVSNAALAQAAIVPHRPAPAVASDAVASDAVASDAVASRGTAPAGAPAKGRAGSRAAHPLVVALAASPATRAAITIAFEHHVGVLPGDAEIGANGLYLARDLTTGTGWAVAEFKPTKKAFAEQRSMGPPFPNGVLPSRPDPVVAIAGGADTLDQRKDGPWTVVAQGGVDWPCPGILPTSALSAWHLQPSVLCRAEHAAPLRALLPAGTYFGYITALNGKGSTIVLDPETIAPNGSSARDIYPYTYRLSVGPYTTVEVSVGFNAAAAQTIDERWGKAFEHELALTNTPNTPNGAPWQYGVTVMGGKATFIKQFSNITPYCSLSGSDEPTSPSDRSRVTVPSLC
jgi:hypothetical protein